ncbi:hypothetical protein CJF32_00006608 [Rutstroemia sp. NJR-2017a WRK4]|nr:hypothetical protein CJF32_00006608 [Rutstroemia sp. NJR-2017a WRK4]
MAPTILIVGATGNTGRSVVETLSKSLGTSTISGHRLLAVTRSSSSPAAQKLAELHGVELVEQNWVDITADWLREHEVARAFIASHNEPTQFAEESTFHLAALRAGVKYVVRISTTAANVKPDCDAYYPRQHWAIETMLSSPEFQNLHWTSLQPNVFTNFWLTPAAELVKKYRETGKQTTLRLMASEDAPVGVIDPDEVGVFAAQLLLQENTAAHNKARYVLNGPEDITGKQIVELVEQYIGTKVENVTYKDTSFIDEWAAATPQSKSLILSVKHAPVTAFEGKATASTTSKEVLELAAPKHTCAEIFKTMLEG